MYTHFATGHGAAAEIDFQGAENACRLLLAASENRKSSKWKYPG
jgi:hypothetical protein